MLNFNQPQSGQPAPYYPPNEDPGYYANEGPYYPPNGDQDPDYANEGLDYPSVSTRGALPAQIQPQEGVQGGPRGKQMEPKLGPKSKTKKKMLKEALQDRLGEVLKTSWGDLWAILAELEAILGRFGRG